MFKIKNENELKQFLKIVSEEAVRESKRILKEKKDNYADNFKKNLDTELSNIYEEEEEKDNESDVEEKDDAKEKSIEGETTQDEDDDTPGKNPAAEKALKVGGYERGFAASFDSVVSSLNTLRAGRSLKDKEINTELRDYYDRLDDNERSVLLLFLRELSKILTGALEGEDAQDPSDPKTYFNITKRGIDDPSPGEKKPVQKQKLKVGLTKKQSGEEDTSPPIKVNETQDFTLLRKQINEILKKD